jgi:hypothetical protein
VRLGATPLHFAVFSKQLAFVQLILEQLCSSDMQRLDALWDLDNSGNTVLHIAVMAESIEIYDYLRSSFLHLESLLLKTKASDGRVLKCIQSDIHLKNALNFTPLELAAALGKCDMLSHMISTDVITLWEYNDFSLKGFAMGDIDTFKTLALDRWHLAQQVGVAHSQRGGPAPIWLSSSCRNNSLVQATRKMRQKERLQHHAGVGVMLNAAHKWLYGSLALLVSKSHFECNVLEIILERKNVNLCDIRAVVYLTKQKWEVLYLRRFQL